MSTVLRLCCAGAKRFAQYVLIVLLAHLFLPKKLMWSWEILMFGTVSSMLARLP